MPEFDIERMSLDELWQLHLELGEMLTKRLAAEKEKLEERLRQFPTFKPADRSKRKSQPRAPAT